MTIANYSDLDTHREGCKRSRYAHKAWYLELSINPLQIAPSL
jgi:hypothetical protein